MKEDVQNRRHLRKKIRIIFLKLKVWNLIVFIMKKGEVSFLVD